MVKGLLLFISLVAIYALVDGFVFIFFPEDPKEKTRVEGSIQSPERQIQGDGLKESDFVESLAQEGRDSLRTHKKDSKLMKTLNERKVMGTPEFNDLGARDVQVPTGEELQQERDSLSLMESLREKKGVPFGGYPLETFVRFKINTVLKNEKLDREQRRKVHSLLLKHFEKAHEINILAIDSKTPPSEILDQYQKLYETTFGLLNLEMDYLSADALLNREESSYENGEQRLRRSMGNTTLFTDQQNEAMERAIHRVLLENPGIPFSSRGHQGGLSIGPWSTEADVVNGREYLKGVKSYGELSKKSYETISDGKDALLRALGEEGVFDEKTLLKLEREFRSDRRYLESLARRNLN